MKRQNIAYEKKIKTIFFKKSEKKCPIFFLNISFNKIFFEKFPIFFLTFFSLFYQIAWWELFKYDKI